LGLRSGPNGSGQLIGFIWAKFQAKRLILDPKCTKFDVFGAGPNFGRDLTSPVAAMYLAAGAFFPVKMATLDSTSPVAAMYLAAGAFFSVKMATCG